MKSIKKTEIPEWDRTGFSIVNKPRTRADTIRPIMGKKNPNIEKSALHFTLTGILQIRPNVVRKESHSFFNA